MFTIRKVIPSNLKTTSGVRQNVVYRGLLDNKSLIEQTMSLPTLKLEKELWGREIGLVVGADEVGRGSFAGPVVSGLVGFSSDIEIPEALVIKDSKELTQKKREKADLWIKKEAQIFGLGEASVREIDSLGIVGATNRAYRRAVKNAVIGDDMMIYHLLVDGFKVPRIRGLPQKAQTAIVKGDSISISIAAASIIAKVYRDALMIELDKNQKYSRYQWHQNKGYGTKAHRDAIISHGKTIHHTESNSLQVF